MIDDHATVFDLPASILVEPDSNAEPAADTRLRRDTDNRPPVRDELSCSTRQLAVVAEPITGSMAAIGHHTLCSNTFRIPCSLSAAYSWTSTRTSCHRECKTNAVVMSPVLACGADIPVRHFARLGERALLKAPKRLTPRADGTRRLYLASGKGLWTMVAEIRHTEGCHGDEGSECALMLPRNEAPFICLFPYRKAWA